MEREIGNTGIRVYPIGLGAMHLSLSGRPAEKDAIGVIEAALEAGVTFIDTANSYCRDEKDKGHNEQLIAKALRQLGAGQRVTVATKGGLTRHGGGWQVDAHPRALRAACDQSLQDLGVEAITLYQLHAPDSRVPYEESVGTLGELQAAGKIRHIGLSNVSKAQLDTARGLVTVQSVQNRLNPGDRGDLRNDMVDYCASLGITYIPYSPVGGGHGHRRLGSQRALAEAAKRHGVSPYQVALAWLLSKGPHMLPIPGASRPQSIRDSAQAAHLSLPADELERLDAAA